MARKPQPGWWIYKEQMDFLCLGDALWEPAPTNYTRVRIGDVGFIRRGQFHLLFSAGSPLGERRLGIDVPDTFEELKVGSPAFSQPRLPTCLRTDTVRELGVGLGAVVSTPVSVETGTKFAFELTGSRGAALVTKHPTYREDSLLESAFEKYTKRHYESWVAFARKKQYGNDVQPVLVSGLDVTGDFAMVAYSQESTSIESDITVTVPTLASASASLWGTWRTKCTPHTNCGPQQCRPPQDQQTIEFSPPHLAEKRSTPSGFNQCVFVRYYTMRKRMAMFPKIIRAGAGPHDLGPGDNTRDTLPELASYSDAESVAGGDDDLGELWAADADDTGSGSDIVVRNTPHDGEYDSWNSVADYIFQNSDADSALMHQRDLAGIHMTGDTSDIASLLVKHKPRITVDEDGVGRITCRKTDEPVPINQPVPPDDGTVRPSVLQGQHLNDIDESLSHPQPNPPSPIVAKDYKKLWKSVAKATNEGKAVQILVDILSDEDGREFISNLERTDAELCIEILTNAVAGHDLKPTQKQAFFLTLRRLAGIHAQLPESMVLAGNIEIEDNILASGGFADVRMGEYAGHPVSVKRLRVTLEDDVQKIRERFCREVVLWNALSHPNVLKLIGVHGDVDRGQFIIVSRWMAHGNIMEYTRKNHTNRLELLYGAAKGLEYIHGLGLVHGGLQATNILMSNDIPPHACLAGPSSVTTVLDPSQLVSRSARLEAGVAFMSPELLAPSNFGTEDSTPITQVDIYAFGLVIFQVLTGKAPFRDLQSEELRDSVIGGLCPTKPEDASAIGFSDSLWDFVQRCWSQDMKSRPSVVEVVEHLERSSRNWVGLMPPCAGLEGIALGPEDEMPNSLEHYIYQSSGVAPKSPAESKATSESSSRSSTPSSQCSQLSFGNLDDIGVTEHFNVPQPEPPVPALPLSQPPSEGRKGFGAFLGSKFNEIFYRSSKSTQNRGEASGSNR